MKSSQQGFSLLETILAIALLSLLSVQVIAIVSDTVAISEISHQRVQTHWALKQGVQQAQHWIQVNPETVSPNTGFKEQFQWCKHSITRFGDSCEEYFIVKVTAEKPGVKPSGIMGIFSQEIGQFGQFIDPVLGDGRFITVTVEVYDQPPEGESDNVDGKEPLDTLKALMLSSEELKLGGLGSITGGGGGGN